MGWEMSSRAITTARSLKHRAYVGYKRLRWPVYERLDPVFRAYRRLVPYAYRAEPFHGTFVDREVARALGSTLRPVPRRIFCLWTGDNEMPEVRRRSFESLQESSPDVEVVLVTADSLHEWVLPEEPLHPAYEGLSFVHRSDYLRCYLLHFHGGGYADLKPHGRDWSPAFDALAAGDKWMAGYRNPTRLMTPNFADTRLQREMRRGSEMRLGQSSYIARPGTPLTTQWWDELTRRMDLGAPHLGPSPGATRSEDSIGGYPFHWNELLAQIIDPLELRFHDKLLYRPDLRYDLGLPYL